MRYLHWLAAVVLVAAGTFSQAGADNIVAYGTGPDPWGYTTNDTVLDTVVGSGNWNKFDLSTAAGTTALHSAIVAGTYQMVFLDGGDGATPGFENFVNTYRGDLETYVNNGGRLLLNAARWSNQSAYPDLPLVFGASLHNNNYDTASDTGQAVNPANPLFTNLGFGDPGTSWTGTYFSHDSLTGSYGDSLITGGAGQTVLSSMLAGNGFVMLGGIVDPHYQSPFGAALSLRSNMIYMTLHTQTVPEPATLLSCSMGAILVGGAMAWRRRSKARGI